VYIILLELHFISYYNIMEDKKLTAVELDAIISRLTAEKKGNDVKMA
jgi:hypothetical protein